jgi:hypothetical protein
MRHFLQFRGSRAGLFYDLSVGDSCPLRIAAFGSLRFPPQINHEKNGALPPVNSEKASLPVNSMHHFTPVPTYKENNYVFGCTR